MQYIPINNIQVNDKQRKKCDASKIAKHIVALENGDCFPIDVSMIATDTYVINGNGRHRYFAYLESGYTIIPVNVI